MTPLVDLLRSGKRVTGDILARADEAQGTNERQAISCLMTHVKVELLLGPPSQVIPGCLVFCARKGVIQPQRPSGRQPRGNECFEAENIGRARLITVESLPVNLVSKRFLIS